MHAAACFALTERCPSQESAWASRSMRSAYIKAVHVAKFTKAAHTAQRRREQQQQQQQADSSLSIASCPGHEWPQSAQHRQMSMKGAAVAGGPNCAGPTDTFPTQRDHSAASASSSPQGPACSWPKAGTTLGKPPTFRRLPISNSPAPVQSRHSSLGHATALAESYSQPLARRLSTVANHTASRHAFPPELLSRARRPATVDCTPVHASHRRSSASSKAHKADTPPVRPAVSAALLQDIHTDNMTPVRSAMPASPLGKVLIRAESGSLDSALQHRSQIPPEEIWQAALSAADLGHVQEAEQARFSRLPDPYSPRHPHTCLTANTMLAVVQGELTTSNDSSPSLSPRPPSRAVDHVPDLKARCALADSNSPGVTPRLMVHTSNIGVGRFEAHLLDAEEDVEQAKERCSLLAKRLAHPAEMQDGEAGRAPMALLQHQVAWLQFACNTCCIQPNSMICLAV